MGGGGVAFYVQVDIEKNGAVPHSPAHEGIASRDNTSTFCISAGGFKNV